MIVGPSSSGVIDDSLGSDGDGFTSCCNRFRGCCRRGCSIGGRVENVAIYGPGPPRRRICIGSSRVVGVASEDASDRADYLLGPVASYWPDSAPAVERSRFDDLRT